MLFISRYRVQEGIMSNLLAESSVYTQLGFFYDLLDGSGFDNYLIIKSKAIEMTEVALRSRRA